MKRPTVALCMIVKNEADNLPRLLDSIEGCFDEIHITDTGSTDDTVKIGESRGCQVHHFEWVNDFAKARNFSFSQAKTDFICWLDGDDVLSDREQFIKWRNDCMWTSDYWMAVYDYACDDQGKPVVSFARERVIRNNLGLSWTYFVHEGIPPESKIKKDLMIQYATTWRVVHMRNMADMQKDKFRNIKLFEANKDKIDPRMTFYLGKEYFEANRPMEAFPKLMDAVVNESLAPHDRQLGIQYACYSLMQCNQFERAIPIAFQGLQLNPLKAEYYVIIGDCSVKLGKLREAIPFYQAAKNCTGVAMPGDVYAGATFNYANNYRDFPRNQLAKIYFQLGEFEKAMSEAKECVQLYNNDEAKRFVEEVTKAISETFVPVDAKEDRAIVLTTPPLTVYPWDEDIAKEKGMGGSETAAIEMMKWIKTLKPEWSVKIYNVRDEGKICESGVEYHPTKELTKYMAANKPAVHVAWRHNNKITQAQTFLWCHDLVTQGVEVAKNFDKIFALSSFHRRYISGMQGVPDDKFIMTRNGIDPDRFKNRASITKNPNKIIWPSSPDRGLERAIGIVERAKREFPELELHVFYGFENLYKYGKADQAKRLEQIIKERPWVKSHGFTQQNELALHFMESIVWLYPASFIESFCISAIESLCSGCYPLARDIGALQDTLKEASDQGMATILDLDCSTDEQYEVWSQALINIIKEKKWEQVIVDPQKYSWKAIAAEWVEIFRPYMEG